MHSYGALKILGLKSYAYELSLLFREWLEAYTHLKIVCEIAYYVNDDGRHKLRNCLVHNPAA